MDKKVTKRHLRELWRKTRKCARHAERGFRGPEHAQRGGDERSGALYGVLVMVAVLVARQF